MQDPATILVVDDEPDVCSFLEELLTQEGHRVVSAASGEEALAEISARRFDLALIDLRLKEFSGLDVMSSLRQQSPDTVAIMLTGHGTKETAVEALRQGAHDYLEKPCDASAIRESVRQGLKKRRDQLNERKLLNELKEGNSPDNNSDGVFPEPALPSWPYDEASEESRFIERGGLTIDFMRHQIVLNGNLMELSPTEFDLLAYLCIQAPRVVSSEELVREVQQYYIDPAQASEIVRYHIYRIRRKARAVATQTDLIRTVRGIGYTVGDKYMP